MTTFYYTYDFDTNYINENAKIYKIVAKDENNFIEKLLSQIKIKNKKITHVFTNMADFSDCWIKTHEKPSMAKNYYKPFSWADIEVRSPGTHPGGNSYWITPRRNIFAIDTYVAADFDDDDFQEIIENYKKNKFEMYTLKNTENL